MSTEWLTVLIVAPTAMVVVAIFGVLWRERTSARQSKVAIVSGIVLAGWAIAAGILAARGFFRPPDTQSPPPIGIYLAVVMVALSLCLVFSKSLRSLLSNQKNLIRLNLWRLVGAVFLILMVNRQMPALWALPAGIGDIIVGATALWVASHFDAPGGQRLAMLFNLFGMADLIVAVGLGIMTSPGPTQVFHTIPTAEFATQFPLALVPTFLVPLAFMLHIVSLWQLFGKTWTTQSNVSDGSFRRLGR